MIVGGEQTYTTYASGAPAASFSTHPGASYTVGGGSYAVGGGSYAVGSPIGSTYVTGTPTTTVLGGGVVTGGNVTRVVGRSRVGGVSVVGGGNMIGTGIGGGALVGTTTIAPPIYQQAVVEEIPSESRIEYVPYEKKYIEYDTVERVEQIPVQRVITEYDEVHRQERVPIERVIQDYYAVEYQTEYIPRVIEETVIDYVQQEKHFERVQYLPVETQIIHYPEAELASSQVQVVNGGVRTSQYGAIGGQIVGGTTYTTGAPATYTTGYTTGYAGNAGLAGTTYVTNPASTTYVTNPASTTYVNAGNASYNTGYVSSVPATTTYVSNAGTGASYNTGYVSSVPAATTTYVSNAGGAGYSTGYPTGGYTTTNQTFTSGGQTYTIA